MTTERFATADLDPSERLAFWNRVGRETYGELAVDARAGSAFGGLLLRRPFGSLTLTQVTTTPATVRGCSSGTVPRDPEHANVMLQDAGASDHVMDGKRIRLEVGSVATNLESRPYSIAFDETTRLVIVRVPLALLASRIGHPARMLETRVESRDAELLAGFLRRLVTIDEQVRDPGWDHALEDVIVDLITIAYRHRTAAPPVSVADERWQRTVRAFVARHLGDPELGAAMIAQRLGVTPRYVQMVFAKMATTASAYIRRRRLELAAQLLVETREPIIDVAARVGFGDLSTFYRGFRKQYGVPPSRYARR